jgi:hypothetical protein
MRLELGNLLVLFDRPLLQRLDGDHQDSVEVAGGIVVGVPMVPTASWPKAARKSWATGSVMREAGSVG